MTNDNPEEQQMKEKPQQEQKQKKSFQVVLVDIEKAAKDNVIQCIKKPLEEKELTFVALSYRWGELHETLVDTGVGYTASITSFHLNDFYRLCRMMTFESDTKDIKYVWVDAICVDQHPARRKATIYQMNNIYDKAMYILAVPDLHLAYLKRLSIKNNETIMEAQAYIDDLYHLIHGDVSDLATLEDQFLTDSHVPKDPTLRQLLREYTDHFTHGFLNYQEHASFYCPLRTLDHLCEQSQVHRTSWRQWMKSNSDTSFQNLHQCSQVVCPLSAFRRQDDRSTSAEQREFNDANWKSKIIQRSMAIRQSMEFLTDLVRDWSSRVWVISEYNIAKKKNNLKFWFTQFSTTGFDMHKNTFVFFKFDFEDASFSNMILKHPYYSDEDQSHYTRSNTSNPVYIRFHYTMIRQLAQQTFLEMMLGSKASRNEDRFHSILPLTEYKSQITEVRHWNVTSLLSVKLKLYEILNNKDRLVLLFWSGNQKAIHGGGVLPTFATSTLPLEFNIGHLLHLMTAYSQFDLDNPSTITFHQTNHSKADEDEDEEDEEEEGDPNRYYLRLQLNEYYVADSQYFTEDIIEDCLNTVTDSIPLYNRLGIYEDGTTIVDIVSIPAFKRGVMNTNDHQPYYLILIGSFAKNIWILNRHHFYNYPEQDRDLWTYYNVDDEPIIFDIY
ncbi:unnamed protein product [Absidia cylindrospora]